MCIRDSNVPVLLSRQPVAKLTGVVMRNVRGLAMGGHGKTMMLSKDDVLKVVPAMGSSNHGGRIENREKLSMLRRKVAERLVSVKNETAMLTTFNEVNMQEIFDLRKKYKETFKAKHDVSLGFMSFFTKAVTRALKLFPDVNSMTVSYTHLRAHET